MRSGDIESKEWQILDILHWLRDPLYLCVNSLRIGFGERFTAGSMT